MDRNYFKLKSSICSSLVVFLCFIFIFSLKYVYSFQSDINPYVFLEKDDRFVITPELEIMVNFWKDVYTKYPKTSIVIHDRNHLDVIYEVFDTKKYINKGYSRRKIWKIIGERKLKYKRILRYIYRNLRRKKHFSGDTLRIYNLYRKKNLLEYLYKGSRNIRCQQGLKEMFKNGLIVSGRYMKYILEIFNREGIPLEFAIIPHIESSFNYRAYSKFGASGLWQFTRSTGRKYLTINYIIDERRDPIRSTEAIAKSFKESYNKLGDWKLVLLSHIYGINGTQRAIRQLRTKNIVTIINKHKGRVFGFASKNFYPEFLAAKNVVKNYEKYFGRIKFEKPIEFERFLLPDYLNFSAIKKYFNIEVSEFSELNPAILKPVYKGECYLPKGFELKLPSVKGISFATLYEQIPGKYKAKNQKFRGYYRVKWGDNLSFIARILKVRLRDLIVLNNIKNPNRIRAGQRLKIPGIFAYLPENDNNQINEDRSVLTIFVKDNETLSHYADWSNTSTYYIRQINNLSSRWKIHYGQKIIIPLSKASKEEFLEERESFHKDIEEKFFHENTITTVRVHRVRSGENIWLIVKKFNNIPIWLLEKYNKNKFLPFIKKGDRINIPIVEKIADVGS
ncbi:hypothetical protein DRQ09_01405 [candidate division KSB1 bacterium]|nr:MAG: hypothetical protein DRQ09_01405 [candidate division KSB1 bacterium]